MRPRSSSAAKASITRWRRISSRRSWRGEAEILAEAVLVHLLVGLEVPQPAIVRADLVGEDEADLVVLVEPAELDLEIDEADLHAKEEAGQEVVDPERHLHHVVEILGRRPAEGGDVLLRDHGIAELVVLVIILYDR